MFIACFISYVNYFVSLLNSFSPSLLKGIFFSYIVQGKPTISPKYKLWLQGGIIQFIMKMFCLEIIIYLQSNMQGTAYSLKTDKEQY